MDTSVKRTVFRPVIQLLRHRKAKLLGYTIDACERERVTAAVLRESSEKHARALEVRIIDYEHARTTFGPYPRGGCGRAGVTNLGRAVSMAANESNR